ncbi:MAG: hypothetical protein P8Z79_17620 [Sedimentisphaerales bacterium]
MLLEGDLEIRLFTRLELRDVIDLLGALLRGAEMLLEDDDDLAIELLLLLLFPPLALCREVLPARAGSTANPNARIVSAIFNTHIFRPPFFTKSLRGLKRRFRHLSVYLSFYLIYTGKGKNSNEGNRNFSLKGTAIVHFTPKKGDNLK